MASTAQPSFANRPYSNLHGKLPDRTAAGFAQSAHTGPRDNARLERERQERSQREAQSAAQGGSGAQNPLSSITDEQREEINEAFGLFDLDKDQRIDYHEFKVALKALGFDLPKSEILALLTANGIPKDAPIAPHPPARNPKPPQNVSVGKLILTLQSFQSIAATLIAQRDPKEEILRAFALFDTEDKGIISIEDLRRVARELGEALEEDELTAMIEEFDLEGKGGVGKDEFIGICMG
ncbi:EF-hand [Glarea lozoyensis ATCC 20868]|uniref:EF-hand n=1 Tax=Glarea lozoyensis (strain ATCC 20868 / MF5171) TaxID=1116229 RepID=S3D839_GLAL2|nr:EF-hand [Glarea lozoyensis ATCC 20868]EPE33915.1 EF-hand [Glarea lozoyensis ATCC 20868]